MEIQIEEKIEFEKRKTVKTEKDIRNIDISFFSNRFPYVIQRIPGNLIMDVIVGIFRKGKAEWKENGEKDAKKLYKTNYWLF